MCFICLSMATRGGIGIVAFVWRCTELWWTEVSAVIAISYQQRTMFHNCSFPSPEEKCWPVHIFYGPDSQLNLNLNIGGGNGYLNSQIDKTAQKRHKTSVASDNMFANAILGGGLDPKEQWQLQHLCLWDNLNMLRGWWKTLVCGLNWNVKLYGNIQNPCFLLFQQIISSRVQNTFVRITEHLLTLRVMSCLNEGVLSQRIKEPT